MPREPRIPPHGRHENPPIAVGLASLRRLGYENTTLPPRRLTNGYPTIDLNRRWHFTITLNLSDRRHSNSDHPAPTQLYRGNLPHYHWPGRLVQLVRTLGSISEVTALLDTSDIKP